MSAQASEAEGFWDFEAHLVNIFLIKKTCNVEGKLYIYLEISAL